MNFEGIEKSLFYASQGMQSLVALFGAGVEIKHLVLDGKCLSIEVFHPDAQTLDDRELLLIFENCAGSFTSWMESKMHGAFLRMLLELHP